MKNHVQLWTKQYSLIILLNFILYIVYYQLMLWSTSYSMHRWNATVSQAGLAAGIFIISALVARMLTGHFIDGLGHKKLLMAGTALYFVATFLYFPVESLTAFDCVRVVQGFGYGMASTAASTIVATIIPVQRQGEGIGYFTLGVTLASAIGPFLGIYFSHRGNYNASLWLCLVCSCAAFLLALPVKTRKRELTQIEKEEMRSLRFSTFFVPQALPISGIAFLGGVCYSTVLSYMGAYSAQLNLYWAGSVFFLFFALTSVLSRPVTGRALDAFGGNVVVYPALVFLALAMAVIGIARSSATLISGALLLGLGFATITSACHALAVFVSPRRLVGRATATYFVLLDVGVGVGPYTLGMLVPKLGFSAVYFAAGLVATAGLVIYALTLGRNGVFSGEHMQQVRRARAGFTLEERKSRDSRELAHEEGMEQVLKDKEDPELGKPLFERHLNVSQR